jgi:hypothetical protein
MRSSRSVFGIFISLFFLALLSHAVPKAACTFTTFTVPAGYTLGAVNSIDDAGTVVGQLQDNQTGLFVAFLRTSGGAFTIYTAPNSTMTWYTHRLSSGVNVGSYQDKNVPAQMHGFAQQGSNFTAVNYPKAKNTWLFGINNAGTVVGTYSTSSGVAGFQLANGNYTIIQHAGAASTTPQSINDSGVVVGSYTVDGWVNYGFVWQGGTFAAVDYPKSKYGSILTDINNAGVIVGNHISADNSNGFIYKNSAFKQIHYTGAKSTIAGGINNSGAIAGEIVLKGQNPIGYTAVCK